MKKIALLLTPALLIAAFISLAVGNSEKAEPPKYSTKVRLSIAANEEIKNEVYSYLSRELRSLGDVKLVEDEPDWNIQVVAMQIKNKLRYETGVAFSVVIEKRGNVTGKLLLIVPHVFQISSEEWEKLKETKHYTYTGLETAFTKLTYGLTDIRAHWLRIGGTEDVQRLCQGIVADFDAEHLKTEREMWQKFWEDLFRQYPPKDGSTKKKGSVFDDLKKPKDN